MKTEDVPNMFHAYQGIGGISIVSTMIQKKHVGTVFAAFFCLNVLV